MQKRTWSLLARNCDKERSVLLAPGMLCMLLLMTCMLPALPISQAQAGVEELSRFMPDRLGRSRDAAANRREQSSSSQESATTREVESVQYTPLHEDAPAPTGGSAKPVTAQDSDVDALDPAQQAAERARQFRLTLDKPQETGVSAGDTPEEQEAKGDTPEAGKTIPTVHETMNNSETGAKRTAPSETLNFERCVHLALKQSPYFVDSAMEVQSRRIDESDSWYQLLPKLLVSTGYVISGPDMDSSDRFSLSFSTGNYDPISAGFSINANKLLTRIAILGHMSSINNGLYNLGNMFMTLGQLEQLLVLQDELVSLAMHEKTYLTNLTETGGANPLEVRIAEQQVEMAVLQRESLEARRDELKDDLKIFLGLGVEDSLKLDLADAGDQVLGYFRPEDIGVDTVTENSIDLQIQKKTREIQQYNIKLAWAKYLPKFYFQARTADPIDRDDADDGLYTSVGFTWTLWDWGERYRNVKRQRLNSRQDLVKENILELDIASNWRSGLSTKRRTGAALKVARAEVELAGLLKRQGEISYQAGTQPFPSYLGQIREYFLARKETLDKELQDDKAMLDLRYMSGDLFNSYINAKEI